MEIENETEKENKEVNNTNILVPTDQVVGQFPIRISSPILPNSLLRQDPL